MFLKIFLLSAFALCAYAQISDQNLDEPIFRCEKNDKDESIHLEKSGLEFIHRDFVSSNKVKCLNLQNNRIKKIDNSALDGLPNLRYVNLAENKLDYKFFLDGNTYPNVETLVLDKALAGDDDEQQCDHGVCVKEVSISIDLPNLKNLYLRKNNLTSLYIESWIEKVPKLSHLYLSNNQLTTIDFMSDVSCTLTHLYLDHNNIDLFIHTSLANLRELVMDYNKIYTLCGADDQCAGGILKGAKNLQNLSLSNVELSYIYPNAMLDLVNLEKLDLSHNHMRTIEDNVFNNTLNLRVLKLDHNELLEVPNLCVLKKLETLTLNRNNISRIDQVKLNCNFSSLRYLSLADNQINFIDMGAFADLLALKRLDLAGNKLQALSDNWISRDIHLYYLYLNDNLFTNTTSMKLENATELKVLRIFGNPLKKISVKSFKYLPEDSLIDVELGAMKVQSCN